MLDDLTFTTPGRDEAEETARALWQALAGFGVELDDIHLAEPCHGCGRPEYKIGLGTYHVEDVRAFAAVLRPPA